MYISIFYLQYINNNMSEIDLIAPKYKKDHVINRLINNTITKLEIHAYEYYPNDFNNICAALTQNTSVKEINIQNTRINSDSIKHIADFLKITRCLTSILFWNTNIGSEGAKILAEGLKENRSLLSFSISGSLLGNEGVKHICEAINYQKLNKICFGVNNIDHIGAKYIGEMLETNRSITSLYLDNNQVGSEGARYIVDSLKNRHVNLKMLNLSSNYIGLDGIKYICENITNVTELNISSNNIKKDQIKYISNMLKKNDSIITGLNISGSYICIDSITELSDALKQNTTLNNLDINDNKMMNVNYLEYISILINALKQNTVITTLNLSRFSIFDANKESSFGSVETKLICDMLKINNTITELDLSGHKIEPLGYKYICDMLKINNTIKKLNLINIDSGVCAVNCKLMASSLKINTTLSELNLFNIKSGSSCKNRCEYIYDALKYNGSITCIKYNYGDTIYDEFCERNKHNIRLKSMTLCEFTNLLKN
jgi:Ran GTPase-activating protein (RanGAP) involved in mRNA processing and transport